MFGKRIAAAIPPALFALLGMCCIVEAHASASRPPAGSTGESEPAWIETDLRLGNVTQVCGAGKIRVSSLDGVLSFDATEPHGELCDGVFYGNNLLIGLGEAYTTSGFEFTYEAQVAPGKGLEIDAFSKDSTYHVGTKFRQNGEIVYHAARNPTTFGLTDEGSIGEWNTGDSWVRVHVVIHNGATFSVMIDDKPVLAKKAHGFGVKTISSLTLLYSDLGGRIRNLRHRGVAAGK